MVQRRTMYRMFLLLPTRATRDILYYCLGYVLEKFDVELHEFVFLSNHYHLVVTDPHAQLPAFVRELNSLIARSVNSSLGRWEAVWSVESYCAPGLCGGQDILNKSIYTLCNVNQAGLVRHVKDYGGPSSWNLEYGSTRQYPRPEVFFSASMPDSVGITLKRPATVRPELSDRELRGEIRRIVTHREIANAHRIRRKGGAFLGMERVLRQAVTATPRSQAARRGIRPRVAGRSRWARIERIRRNQEFERLYRAAWLRLHEGDRDVVFPQGTYKLRVELSVRCRGPS